MENHSSAVEANASLAHDRVRSKTRVRGALARGLPPERMSSPDRVSSPAPSQRFWNVTLEQKVEILKVNLEQHARTVDEQIRSLRQELAPQKSMCAPDVPPSSNLENEIKSVRDALQELSLTVQVLKDERSSRGSKLVGEKIETFADGSATTMPTCTQVESPEIEHRGLMTEVGDTMRTHQGMKSYQESHGGSVMQTDSLSMTKMATWNVSIDATAMGHNTADEALLCFSRKPASPVTLFGLHKRTQPYVSSTHSTEFKRKARNTRTRAHTHTHTQTHTYAHASWTTCLPPCLFLSFFGGWGLCHIVRSKVVRSWRCGSKMGLWT